MPKKQSVQSKFDWNIFLTAISVLAAIVSSVIAINANQIARESQSPKISANISYWYQTYALFGNNICKDDNGSLVWDTTFIVAVDITNTGGKATTVVEVQKGSVQSPNPAVGISVHYEQFQSADSLTSWLQNNTAAHDPTLSGIGKLDINKVDYSGFPLTIDSGQTVRIVLQGYEFISGDTSLTPEQILKVLQQADWLSDLTFVFGDQQKETVSVKLAQPWEVIGLDPLTTNPCKK